MGTKLENFLCCAMTFVGGLSGIAVIFVSIAAFSGFIIFITAKAC